MKRLAILGASGHGKVVADLAELNGWGLIEFYDDAWPSVQFNNHWPVVGTFAHLQERTGEYEGILVAIGNNAVRHAKLVSLGALGAIIPTLVHPAACVSRYASIAPGTVVFAGAVVNAGAVVGSGCILNTSCSVDHDCTLSEAVHVSPGAHLAGGVAVGPLSWVGIGACVKQEIRIGAKVQVGAGAVVVCPIADNQVVIGIPAKPKAGNL
ncbi:acetyltransferase [Pseudomonas sp. BBP2017]|uniref:acetyltransferase n=1 Tax=Pseudomonas sp. BBP2017 TaxID=2109731 RepID=UPI000D138AB7|nr:acetyltransferase [Pseudomonas sp. BBP2017]PSS47908.1 acetyltransferase [Pseudomonas sp. BBP2017]